MKTFAVGAFSLFFSAGLLAASVAPQEASVYFISPAEGESLENPVVVRFGLKGMGIAPAGIEMDNTGHHHLIIDAELPPLNMPVPADDQHIHFGKGQTEIELHLEPGEHRLQLLLGDHTHTPHDPPVVSKQISITVK